MAYYALKINDQYDIMKDILLEILSRNESSEESKDYIDIVIQKLDTDALLRPMKLFGYKVDAALASQIFGLLATTAIAFGNLLLSPS
jgi:hypothetical protein